MGLIDFLRDTGKDLFGGRQGNEGESIEREIERALGDNVGNLNATFDNGTVTLTGTAKSLAAKEKATLIAGNVRGVERVNADGITVAGNGAMGGKEMPSVGGEKASGSRFYTVQSGDSLSRIAQRELGDGNRWQELFQANKEVIEDPDLIYPGQQIRIPA
jgi:nucleoid-associated protein YgaU